MFGIGSHKVKHWGMPLVFGNIQDKSVAVEYQQAIERDNAPLRRRIRRACPDLARFFDAIDNGRLIV